MASILCTAYGVAQIPPPSLTTIYTFTGYDACYPGPIVLGAGGVIYGTTSGGGTNLQGTVFSLTPPASPGGTWTESVLHSFTGGSDGAQPNAPLVIGSGGVLYGVTSMYGAYGYGTVYSLTPPATPGAAWTENILYNFAANGHGDNPVGITIGPTGVLYVATLVGGSANYGTVNALTPPATPGAAWTEYVLYSFTGRSSGVDPVASVTIGNGGVLYGGTYGGGPTDRGTVFSLTPPAVPGGAWTEAVLYAAPATLSPTIRSGVVIGGASGGQPVLYGVTWSPDTIYSLSPPATPGGAWTYTELYQFPNSSQTLQPGPLHLGQNGTIYGTTSGSVYVLKPPAVPGGAWIAEVLSNAFQGKPEGLAIGSGGVLYGTVGAGGAYNCGTVFALAE